MKPHDQFAKNYLEELLLIESAREDLFKRFCDLTPQ
jgi:hypothetical protein